MFECGSELCPRERERLIGIYIKRYEREADWYIYRERG